MWFVMMTSHYCVIYYTERESHELFLHVVKKGFFFSMAEFPDSIDQCCGWNEIQCDTRFPFWISHSRVCSLFLLFFSFFFEFEFAKDAGLYRITVENELGRIQANARLDILSRSSGSRSAGFIRSGSAATAGRGTYYSALSGSSASRLAGRTLGLSGAGYLRGTSTPRSGGR